MLEKMSALWSLFRKGEAVADPAKWKSRQITSTMLAGLLIAVVQLAKACGHEIPIDNDTALALAGGIIAAVNTVLTIITSRHAGLPSGAVREAQPSVQSTEQPAENHPEVATEQELPSVSITNVQQSSIDDDTRQRTIAWATEHSKPIVSVDNGLSNDT